MDRVDDTRGMHPAFYSYDDGSTETALAFGGGGHTCWLHCFDAVDRDLITSVSVAWGSSIVSKSLDGQPCTIYVWEDPDDDAYPIDAVAVSRITVTVTRSNTDTFVEFQIPPAHVEGKFFVGCYMDLRENCFAAGIDQSTPYRPDSSWIAGAGTAWDPNDLSGNGGTLHEIGGLGYPAYWMIRANMP